MIFKKQSEFLKKLAIGILKLINLSEKLFQTLDEIESQHTKIDNLDHHLIMILMD